MNDRPIIHANRDARSYASSAPAGQPGGKPKFTAKGHDRTLQDAQHAGTVVTLRLIDDFEYEGTIVRRDKFTITILHTGDGRNHGCEEVVYKHAIRGVLLPKVSA